MRRACGGLLFCLAALSGVTRGDLQHSDYPGDIHAEPIAYGSTAAKDPVAQLAAELESANAALTHREGTGYLADLLARLKIDPASQTLVFTKTSQQFRRIDPAHPRALYFNDDVYVGFVRGGVIELTGIDPKLGAVFYTLDNQAGTPPRIVRDDGCLQCHGTGRTMNIPGLFVRSVRPDADGHPRFPGSSDNIDHRTPVAERWGGWYVTGTHGDMRHLGNAIANEGGQIDTEAGANLRDLSDRIDASRYLQPGSDIAALMVLDHQVMMQTLLTRVGYEAATMLHRSRSLAKELNRPNEAINPRIERRLNEMVDELLRYMLFVDESVLDDPIVGGSAFAARYSARGPRDRQGRSLYELDLKHYLYRRPCSPLIYAADIDAFPPELHRRFWDRFNTILTAEDAPPPFDQIARHDRRAIREILLDTRDNLPPRFGQPAGID